MIRLSVPVRQAVAKLSLPVLVAASFALMLLGKADALLAERLHMAMADTLAPIYGALAPPLDDLRAAIDNATHVFTLAADNARLREENARLLRWRSVALALDAENATLKANLHWIPEPAPSFVTAPVVADAGGVYARAVLILPGPRRRIVKGEIALDDRGLVGRVTEVGNRAARVLLITDLNSRIPVMLEDSRARAIMTGTNGALPRLMYWPEGVHPQEGERVVTSAEAGAFPAGLPIGTVHYSSSNVAEVEPLARLDRLEVVRLFNFAQPGPWQSQPIAARATARPARGATPDAAGPAPPGYAVVGVLRGDR